MTALVFDLQHLFESRSIFTGALMLSFVFDYNAMKILNLWQVVCLSFNAQTSTSACPRNSQPTIHITHITAITMPTVQTQRDRFTARVMWDTLETELFVWVSWSPAILERNNLRSGVPSSFWCRSRHETKRRDPWSEFRNASFNQNYSVTLNLRKDYK